MAEQTSPPLERRGGVLWAVARHQMNALRHTGKALASLVPAETRRHGRAAAREWLLSLHVLLDEAAAMLDDEAAAPAQAAPAQRSRKVKVKVE